MRKLIFSTLATFAMFTGPQTALADTSHCAFSQECLETDACQATDFALTLEMAGTGSKLVSDAETIEGQALESSDGSTRGFFTMRPSGDVHLITIFKDGVARYSTQMPSSGLALYYLGVCKGAV